MWSVLQVRVYRTKISNVDELKLLCSPLNLALRISQGSASTYRLSGHFIGTVLLRAYFGTILPIFIEIGSRGAKDKFAQFLRHGVYDSHRTLAQHNSFTLSINQPTNQSIKVISTAPICRTQIGGAWRQRLVSVFTESDVTSNSFVFSMRRNELASSSERQSTDNTMSSRLKEH